MKVFICSILVRQNVLSFSGVSCISKLIQESEDKKVHFEQ